MANSEQDRPAGRGATSRQPSSGCDGLLAAARNLSRYHREHEKYYSEAPLTDAVSSGRRTALWPQTKRFVARN